MLIDNIPKSQIVTMRDILMNDPNACRLESGTPSGDCDTHVKTAGLEAISSGKNKYCSSLGIPELRNAIAQKIQRENNFECEPKNVAVSHGGMNGLLVALLSCTEPGDDVAIPTPWWVGGVNQVNAFHRNTYFIPMAFNKNGTYEININLLSRVNFIKAIILNSPHNPTGLVIDPENLKRLVEHCKQKEITIISDEAYEHIIYDDYSHVSTQSLDQDNENIISIFSASKSYNMSGLRIGYIVSKSEKIMDRVGKYLLYSVNGASTVPQYMALEAIDNVQSKKEIDKRALEYAVKRTILTEEIRQTKNFSCVIPKGAFYVWMYVKNGRSKEVVDRLINYEKYAVGCIHGSEFGAYGEDYIRLAYSTRMDEVARAALAIKDIDSRL